MLLLFLDVGGKRTALDSLCSWRRSLRCESTWLASLTHSKQGTTRLSLGPSLQSLPIHRWASPLFLLRLILLTKNKGKEKKKKEQRGRNEEKEKSIWHPPFWVIMRVKNVWKFFAKYRILLKTRNHCVYYLIIFEELSIWYPLESHLTLSQNSPVSWE